MNEEDKTRCDTIVVRMYSLLIIRNHYVNGCTYLEFGNAVFKALEKPG